MDENGELVNGRGYKPNRHNILTGSKNDGTAYFSWGKGGNTSWNAAHRSRGCGQADLPKSDDAGLMYCFAAD